jgi:phosphoglycerate kinase
MQIPSIGSIDLNEKRVLVRGDLDGEPESKRLEVLVETINKILDKNAKQVVIMGSRGRPEGKKVDELSNKILVDYFSEKLNREIEFIENVEENRESEKRVLLLENLRFWEGENNSDEEFAKKLSAWGDVYINESFGMSHRVQASIVGVPKLLPHAAGVHFISEVEHLSKVLENPERPLVFLISGIKEDKAAYVDRFKEIADKVLVGGRLPVFFDDYYEDPKVQIARLMPDKEDITMKYIEHFEGEIKRAKTVVVSGPVGKYEDEGHRQGTERVFKAVAEAGCYSVAGGGDTEAALEFFNLKDKIDWISTGGGAMLEFLDKGTLPGIEALIH